jgi:O-antigen ligase
MSGRTRYTSVTQRVFQLIVGVHVMAYTSFFSTILVVVGGRKVYGIDVVFAFLVWGVLAPLASSTPRHVWGGQSSTKMIALFVGWGLFELARGIPSFGLSAFGESRMLVLPTLFLFFFLAIYRDRLAVKKFLAYAAALICIMPVVRGVLFYVLGGRAAFMDQFVGSSVLSTQAGFRFIQAGEAALVSSVAVGLLMFAAAEESRKRRYALLLVATALLIVIAIVQVRTAWLTAFVGISLGSILVTRFLRNAAISLTVTAVAVVLADPVGSLVRSAFEAPAEIALSQSGGTQHSASPPDQAPTAAQSEALRGSLAYSTTFLRDPAADVTAAWRLVLWRQALVSAKEHPLIGQGLGGYWRNVGPNGEPANQLPHNGFLAVLVKLGGVGLALLLLGGSLWCLELVRYIRQEQEPYFRLLAKVVVVVVAMSATFACFYDFTVAFWVLLAAGSVLVRSGAPS